jgi:hyperosmotically inducible protein
MRRVEEEFLSWRASAGVEAAAVPQRIRSAVRTTRAAIIALAAALAGCGGGIQNAPQPGVTQLEHAADDALLTTAVKAKLITVDIDSAASLGVQVAGGVATLTGAVRTPAARVKTVAAAKSVTGIRAVRDELRVDPTVPNVGQRVGDATLAGRISTAIFAQTGSTRVRVDVKNGVVTLHGGITDPTLRAAALDTARNTTGVHRVVDEMGTGG